MLENEPTEVIPPTTFKKRRIQKLSSDLANQIAAGEVIERPASVLKELLENSLDAESTQIDIVIENGGLGLIKVQDNGMGIYQEDLPLALAQHATSKVANFFDLEAISSFGFRGEALASIASVSKLRLSSCPAEQDKGYMIEKEGRENEFSIRPVPRVLGSTVYVAELFYNTPARRHFLRSEKTESTYVEEVFKRIALSHPEVGFNLKFSDKIYKRLPRCQSQAAYIRRVAEICGKSFMDQSHYVEAESNGLILKGWIGKKQQLRASADLQYFYVNGRIIRDKVINHAIRQAYHESYSLGRYPAYILFLELDPAAVDVNVHPTKHEVRFREARIVHAFLTYALSESLMSNHLVANGSDDKNFDSELNHFKAPEPREILLVEKTPKKDMETIESNFEFPFDFDLKTNPPPADNLQKGIVLEAVEKYSFGKPLGMIQEEILILEHGLQIIFVDIRAIDKLNLATQLKISMTQTMLSGSKTLLIPCALKITQQKNFVKLKQTLQLLGFQWTESGIDSVLLRAIPKCLSYYLENKNMKLWWEAILKHSFTAEDKLIELIVGQSIRGHEYTLEKALEILKLGFDNDNKIIFNHKKCYRKFDLNELKNLIFS